MKPQFLVVTTGFNPLCAGTRVLNYLAAMLKAAGYPVLTDETSFYNPMLPILRHPDEDTIVIYPDGVRGNPFGAKKICRYMLYFATGYFGGDRIGKDEACIVYHRDYLENVAAHCDHPLTEDDIVMLPSLDPTWLFPEPKTIKAVSYKGKGGAIPADLNAIAIPEPQTCWHTSRNRTLSMLRMAENFYTTDANTIMVEEAILCGCKPWFVTAEGTPKPLERDPAYIELLVMKPEYDIELARCFAGRIYKFFGL